jgi:hypothetical protein
MLGGRCIVGLAMPVVLIGLAGCVLSRPPPSAYDDPPYSQLIVGTQSAPSTNASAPEFLPDLTAGQFAAFYVCAGGGTNGMLCSEALALPVTQAMGAVALDAGSASSVIRRETSGTELSIASARGRMDRVGDRVILAAATASGTVVSPTETVAMAGREDRTAVAPAGGVREMPVPARIQAEAPTAASTRQVEQHAAAGTAPLVGIHGSAAVETAGARATLGGVDERDWVRMLAEMNVVQVLMDQNLVDGVYDAVNLLMPPVEKVPPEEQALFMQALLKGGPLSLLLDRPCSAGFRTQAGGEGECEAEAKWVPLGKGPHHHGGRAVLVIEAKNRGTRPMYDLLLLAGVPEHARFAMFPVQNPGQSGFLHAHLTGRSLLVWKLYRPLQPGQTFRASVVLTLDPWVVGARTAGRATR